MEKQERPLFLYLVPVSSAPENTPEPSRRPSHYKPGFCSGDDWKTPKGGLVAGRTNQQEGGTLSPAPGPVVSGEELQVESVTTVHHAWVLHPPSTPSK